MPRGRPTAGGARRTTATNRSTRLADRNWQRLRRFNLRRFNGPQIPAALDSLNLLPSSDIGNLTAQCDKCQALHYACEKTGGHFTACCQDGKVPVVAIQSTPLLQELFGGTHSHSNEFLHKIRQCNSALSFTSLGANYVPPPGFGPYCFRVKGTVYHVISDTPPDQGPPQFG